MSQHVKHQFNKPKDARGNSVDVLQPGEGYTTDDLLRQAYAKGWTSNFFSEPDNARNFPYWDNYLMPENGPEVYVSVFGEVACCFNRNVENKRFRILEQQWNKQYDPDDSDEKAKDRQKYLYVYFNNSPYYNITHTGQMLHSMVGLVHSPIYLEDTEWDDRTQMYRLRGRFNLDHLDTDKSNNSVFNLNWTTHWRNQQMTGVDWPIEQKRQFFRDAEKLPKEDRDKLLMRS